MTPEPCDMAGVIHENRLAFMRYTISRLRELLRNLPQNRLDLFHLIPFLLHVNDSAFPGYVESPLPFYGIFRFERSGFYRAATRLLKLSDEKLKQLAPEKEPVLGLYLMGSAGTLTQTGRSDFDFWVIVREDQMGPEAMGFLARKLKAIEAWCHEKHGQEVTFFIMDIEKLRRNEFSTVDGESSGSAQRTLLKDEFYRTFIMIAGKIPLWAVLPPDITEDGLPEFMTAMADASVPMEDYIDTGHLGDLDPRECLGALLWQVYKARKDPVKSLIKASLAAAYAFMDGDSSGLVSSRVRNNFENARIDDYQDDPYTLVFETIMAFYEDMNDDEGLELIRQCIFLRLMSYPLITEPDSGSPKGRLMARFLDAWKPEPGIIERLSSFNLLDEKSKIAFEDRIFDKISFLYELVLRSVDEGRVTLFMNKEDITILKNRTAAFRGRKPGKIPRCSTCLAARTGMVTLDMASMTDAKGGETWLLFEEGKGPGNPVFQGSSRVELLGFLLANRLEKALAARQPQPLDQIPVFFSGVFPRPDKDYADPALPDRLLVFLEAPSRHGELASAKVLFSNTWGEFFHGSLDVSTIESPEGKCYRMSEFLAFFRQGKQEKRFECLVNPPGALAHFPYAFTLKSMSEGEEAMEREDKADSPSRTPEITEKSQKKPKPFLDLI